MRAILLLNGLAVAALGNRGEWQRSPKQSPVELPSSPGALAKLFLAFQPAAARPKTDAEHCRVRNLFPASCNGIRGRAAVGQARVSTRRLAMQETTRLTPLPDYLGSYYAPRDRKDIKYLIVECSKKAIRQALADGVELMEIEFPPLIDIKGPLDDFTNIQVFDANQAFAASLAVDDGFRVSAPGPSLWLVYGDRAEAKLARKRFRQMDKGESSQLSIEAALSMLGKKPKKPSDPVAEAIKMFSGLFGDAKEEQEDADMGLDPSEMPKLQIVVQPGEFGSLWDWLNMEVMKTEGVPMICLNGALDKVRGRYYGLNLGTSDIDECTERFFSKFEGLYYLKPIRNGVGYLFRVYPEPYQLYRITGDGRDYDLLETYDERPTLGECADRLSMK